MFKYQAVLSFQCLLLPSILTISFSLNFQNTPYPWRLLLRIFSGYVCSEYHSCDSLWGIPGCPFHLAVAVLIACACCPPGMSSKSTSWSCHLCGLLLMLTPWNCLEEKGSLQLASSGGNESSEHGYTYLYFSLCIQDKHTIHPSVVAASEESSFAAWPD